MANFLETQPRRYNDYVGMPVDTYSAVGMYKQAMYEQGVQQIQTALSTVAGLDVARPVDKQYLESKVNEVTSKINSIAGGDWSNKNLVSKATGIASSVAKDQYVQDAIYSAAAIKELAASQKALKEKNPELYPVSAEWYDSQELQRYMSSNKIGDRYGGPKEATRHFGVKRDEDIRKALKELHPSIIQTVDESGKYTYTYDKTTTVTPEQIQNVVMGVIGSNPEFQKSMQIDASFSYKDADVTDLIKSIPDKKALVENQLATTNKNIDDIIAANPSMSVSEKEKLLEQKAKNEEKTKERLADYDNWVKEAQSGNVNRINSLKQMNFFDNMLNGYISNFQQFSRETEIKDNIVTKAQLDWIKAGLDPETGLPPTPGSKYYSYAQGLKKEGKEKPNTEGLSTIPATGEANKMQDVPTLEAHIASLEEANTTLYNNFAKDIALKNNLTPDQVKKYMDTQAENFRNGKPVDKDYLQYYKKQQDNTAIITANKEVIMEANKLAENSVPTKNIPNKIIKGTNEVINYSDNNLIKTLYDFDKLVGEQAMSDEAIESTLLSNIGVMTKQINYFVGTAGKGRYYNDHAAAKVLTKFKNNPYYNKLKALVEKGYISTASEIFEPINKIHYKQEEIKNNYIKSRMNTVTGVTMSLSENSDEQKITNSIISTAYSTEDLKKKGVKIPSNINATGVYRDPSTGEIYTTFTSGLNTDKQVNTIKLPSGTTLNFLPPMGAYDKIKTAIEISPNQKSTPLVTSNGKVTYKVGKMGDSYYAQIQINGLWENLSFIGSSDLGTVIEQIETAANNKKLENLGPKETAKMVVTLLNPITEPEKDQK